MLRNERETKIRDYFRLYCELSFLADALEAEPEEFVDTEEYEDLEEVLEDAEDNRLFADLYLEQARSICLEGMLSS